MGNIYGAIPIGHSVTLKEEYANIKVVLEQLKYHDHEWLICVDLKMVSFLLGQQGGYTRYPCFLCYWDSRAKEEHWRREEKSRDIRRTSDQNITQGPTLRYDDDRGRSSSTECRKDDNYREIVEELLLSLRALGCRMSVKVHYLHSHLSKFPDNLGDVFDATVDNARLVLQIDNARLAADDFRVKYESELSIRQSVEADIVGLRKVIDDTNMGRMNLESEIETLKEELIHLKKNHDNDVMELRQQISQSGVQVDVDAPKGQDLAQIMSEIRAKYEKMALKNQEELKAWHESQITEVQSQVTQNTEALKGAQTEVNDLRRQLQTLQIELESQMSLKATLEGTLRDTDMRYNMEMESLNTIIVSLEAELTQLRGNIQQQTQDYEVLLNMKMKLEAEIATYKRLLDGEDFKLQDAMEDQKTVKTQVMTVTQTLVDGKVVSSSTKTKNL
ncbi:keratin, type I cytoskeletal 18-like [Lampris incognitus]|uniref:keratin, type I cytoskeletal 18-like n=1 Tax=Lampris incognitus TaxID=2546036 RepID=UPI0024B5A275|nr:keratin, type I cytoskeletal 18-like [Lampris incognitus]